MSRIKKNTVLIEQDGTHDWIDYVQRKLNKKEFRLIEIVDNYGKKKLNYDIKSYKSIDSELNKNILRFPYKFNRLKIKNYDDFSDTICEDIVEQKDNNKKKKEKKKKIDIDNSEFHTNIDSEPISNIKNKSIGIIHDLIIDSIKVDNSITNMDTNISIDNISNSQNNNSILDDNNDTSI